MTTEKLTEEGIEKIKEADYIINSEFVWEKTKEGKTYWSNVSLALQRIAENGLKNNEKKVCDKCGGELK